MVGPKVRRSIPPVRRSGVARGSGVLVRSGRRARGPRCRSTSGRKLLVALVTCTVCARSRGRGDRLAEAGRRGGWGEPPDRVRDCSFLLPVAAPPGCARPVRVRATGPRARGRSVCATAERERAGTAARGRDGRRFRPLASWAGSGWTAGRCRGPSPSCERAEAVCGRLFQSKSRPLAGSARSDGRHGSPTGTTCCASGQIMLPRGSGRKHSARSRGSGRTDGRRTGGTGHLPGPPAARAGRSRRLAGPGERVPPARGTRVHAGSGAPSTARQSGTGSVTGAE